MAKDYPLLKNEITEAAIGHTFGPETQAAFLHATEVIATQTEGCFERGVLVIDINPQRYIGYFLAAANRGVPVFLGNPNWKERELVEVTEMITPEWVFGKMPHSFKGEKSVSAYTNLIMIPTGGSTGGVKFAMHRWSSLVTSAQATQTFLGEETINSYCVLPLYHVSGMMQAVRSLITKGLFQHGELNSIDAKRFESGCISLVPTQLQRLLASDNGIELLKSFNTVFLGGASSHPKLLDTSRELGLRLSPTYGATETASMIAALKPEEFLDGGDSVGQTLKHSQIVTREESSLVVTCKSLFYGYFPQTPEKRETWITGDEGSVDAMENLHIYGRSDRLINTGGEKVDPVEVERVILESGLVSECLVLGVKDPEWGERVVAACVPSSKTLSDDILHSYLKLNLTAHKAPKDYIFMETLPIDERGKVNRGKVEELLALKVGYCIL